MQLCSLFFCFSTPGFDLGRLDKYTVDSIHCTYLELSTSAFPIHFPERDPYLPGCLYSPPIIKIMVDSRLQMKHEGFRQHCKIQ